MQSIQKNKRMNYSASVCVRERKIDLTGAKIFYFFGDCLMLKKKKKTKYSFFLKEKNNK